MFELERDGYRLSDDPRRLDEGAIFAYLKRTYWAGTREPHTQRLANRNSLCLGLYHGAAQVGFARVITDYATFAYLCDVYVEDAHQGRGLGKWLVEAVHAHPRLQGLRRWSLATRDAHGLYEQFGWRRIPKTDERWMEIYDGAANPPPPAAATEAAS